MTSYTEPSDFNEVADRIAALPHGLVVLNGPMGSDKTHLLDLIQSGLGADNEGECAKLSMDGYGVVDMFGLIDPALPDTHWIGSLRETMRLVAEFGYRVFIIENPETAGDNAKQIIEKSINLALRWTLVVLCVDGSTQEGMIAVDVIRDKWAQVSDSNKLWIDIS